MLSRFKWLGLWVRLSVGEKVVLSVDILVRMSPLSVKLVTVPQNLVDMLSSLSINIITVQLLIFFALKEQFTFKVTLSIEDIVDFQLRCSFHSLFVSWVSLVPNIVPVVLGPRFADPVYDAFISCHHQFSHLWVPQDCTIVDFFTLRPNTEQVCAFCWTNIRV
jgi:hypothetical protein